MDSDIWVSEVSEFPPAATPTNSLKSSKSVFLSLSLSLSLFARSLARCSPLFTFPHRRKFSVFSFQFSVFKCRGSSLSLTDALIHRFVDSFIHRSLRHSTVWRLVGWLVGCAGVRQQNLKTLLRSCLTHSQSMPINQSTISRVQPSF